VHCQIIDEACVEEVEGSGEDEGDLKEEYGFTE
jgi:hypothetical protein